MTKFKTFGSRAVALGLLTGALASPVLAQEAMRITSSGDVGIGTDTPVNKLHIFDGNLRVEQSGAENATLNFYSNGNGWEIKMNKDTGRLTFFSPGGGATTASFKFDRQAQENLFRVGVLGPDIVDINGDLMVTGTISPDYVFTQEYELESIEDHAAFMWENKHLPAVPAAEVNDEGKGIFSVAERSQGVLEELEKAHIYIAQLHESIKNLEARLAAQEQKATAAE